MAGNESNGYAETLDAREVNGEPFEPIMQALQRLEEGNTLLLINSFEPEPLYSVLDDEGFAYETEQHGPEEWHIEIRHA